MLSERMCKTTLAYDAIGALRRNKWIPKTTLKIVKELYNGLVLKGSFLTDSNLFIEEVVTIFINMKGYSVNDWKVNLVRTNTRHSDFLVNGIIPKKGVLLNQSKLPKLEISEFFNVYNEVDEANIS